MKLADDLYVYEWTNPYDNNCNSFYIGGSANVLVDPGLTMYLSDLLLQLKRDGISPEDIRYVVNTHSHPDHFEGSESFVMNNGTAVCLLEEELDFYNNTGKQLYRMFGLAAPDIHPDMILKEGSLDLGGESFEIIHVPGHSPGSLALYWPARKALISGDVIFSRNIGRTDFPGGNGALLKDSIRRLAALDAAYLLPGHMEVIAGTDRVRNNFTFVSDHILPYL